MIICLLSRVTSVVYCRSSCWWWRVVKKRESVVIGSNANDSYCPTLTPPVVVVVVSYSLIWVFKYLYINISFCAFVLFCGRHRAKLTYNCSGNCRQLEHWACGMPQADDDDNGGPQRHCPKTSGRARSVTRQQLSPANRTEWELGPRMVFTIEITAPKISDMISRYTLQLLLSTHNITVPAEKRIVRAKAL